MVLYAADVVDMTPKPEKKKRVSKKKAPEEEVKPEVEIKQEPVITAPTELVPEKPKRKRDMEKVRLAREEKQKAITQVKEELERVKKELAEREAAQKEKPAKKQRTRNPPKWFQSYVEKVQKEESIKSGEKKETKELKSEALEMAKKTWDDGFTRDKVTQEFETHRNRLYSMIFSK